MRILKNLAAIVVCTIGAWGLIFSEYMLIYKINGNLPENKPFMFFISLLPAVILTVVTRLLCNRLDSDFHRYVPIAFLLTGVFQFAAPVTGNFHWFYQMVLSFGAFIWTIIFSIINFILAINKNKKLLEEISEEHEKQTLQDKGEQ